MDAYLLNKILMKIIMPIKCHGNNTIVTMRCI